MWRSDGWVGQLGLASGEAERNESVRHTCGCVLGCVQLFSTIWMVVRQVPLPMGIL